MSRATSIQRAQAAGCAVGYLSQHRMYQYWNNYVANEYGSKGPCEALTQFIDAQMAYTAKVVAGEIVPWGAPEGFIKGLGYVMAEFEGLVEGYSAAASTTGEPLTRRELYMLNAVGDLEDLNGICSGKVAPQKAAREAIRGLTGREVVAGPPKQPRRADGLSPTPEHLKLTDCSGFVGVLPDHSDLVFAQATWRAYYAMLRTYHSFQLDYAPAQSLSFSASPGFLMSKDDYAVTYGTDARLGIFETTNSMFNHSRFEEFLTPLSILTWQRSAIAMRWATSGLSYATLMSFNQSGTYNNQWVVLDSKLFESGQGRLQPDTLWVLELIPGYERAADMTSTLEQQGYWPSYNIPYFADIYNMSGYYQQYLEHGDDFSYSQAPRAQIFRRNASDVTSLEALQSLMRYNRFKTDPLAKGDAILGAIAARGDLVAKKPVAFGAVDAKVITATRISGTEASGQGPTVAVCGPTDEDQPVFSWAPHFENVTHDGVPASFAFDWVAMPMGAT